MQMTQQCAHCTAETRCSRRDFSEQAWSVLLSWKEVNKSSVDQPLCGDCYDELREILIDRADEMALALKKPIVHHDEETYTAPANLKKKAVAAAPVEAKKKMPIAASKKAAPAKKTKRPKRVA
jgi:hypothetical protein